MNENPENTYYEIKSPESPRSYYYNPFLKQSKWNRTPGMIVIPPPDGFYVFPPPMNIHYDGITTIKTSFSQRTLGKVYGKSKSQNSNENVIIHPNLDYKLLARPYFPDNLLLFNDKVLKIDYLKAKMNIMGQKSRVFSSQQMSFEDLISPGKRSISTPLLQSTKQSKLACSLMKSLHKYIKHQNPLVKQYILQTLIGNTDLIDEFALQLVTEANSLAFSDRSRFVWELFLEFLHIFHWYRTPIDPDCPDILSSFLVYISISSSCDTQVRYYSVLSLLRYYSNLHHIKSAIPGDYIPETN